MHKVVPAVTPMSSLSDLTQFLVYSFQESDRKIVEEILANREEALKKEMQKSKEILEKELKEEKTNVEELINSRISFEVKVKNDRDNLIKEADLMQKNFEAVVKYLREELEKELARDSDLMDKRELEEDIRRQRETQKSWKVELEKLREYHQKKDLESREIYLELKLERDLMKSKLALASSEKKKLEDEMRTQLVMYKNKDNLLQMSLKVELETNLNLKRKFSLVSFEKMKLNEDLRQIRNLELGLRKQQMYLEERIQTLERGNLELNKKVELYKENFRKMRDFVEQVIGVRDSSISGNVRAKGVVINGSCAEDVSMFYSREEGSGTIKLDGGCNENNLRQNCKRRRTTQTTVHSCGKELG